MIMSKGKEILEAFNKAKKELCDLFEIEGYYDIQDLTDVKWITFNESGSSYKWMSYIEKNCEYTFERVNEVKNDVEDLVVFYTQDNGEVFYSIFDKSKEMTEEEAEEAGVL